MNNQPHPSPSSPLPRPAGEVSPSSATEGVFSSSSPLPSSSPIPQPIKEPNQSHLPSALTFFLTRAQRTQILRALKSFDQNRVTALIKALNMNTEIK